MKIVLISDTHEQHEKLGRLPEGDILIHAGDYTHQGSRSAKRKFFTWFHEQPHKYKIFVAGNHDFDEPTEGLSVDSSHYLCDSGVEIGGIAFWGSPYTPTFFDWAFMKDRGSPIREHWNKIPVNTNVLITHGPPYGILDRPYNSYNSVGCEELYNSVCQLPNLKLHVFGHIHGASGTLQFNGTTFVNASVVNEAYQVVNEPRVVEM